MIALEKYCNEPIIVLDKNENIIIILMPVEDHEWRFTYERVFSNSDKKLKKHGYAEGFNYTYFIYPTFHKEDGIYCFPLQDYNEEDKKLIKRLAKQIDISKGPLNYLYEEEKEKIIEWFKKNLLTN